MPESLLREVRDADVVRGRWEVKALASRQCAYQFYVQIEHYEPDRGGWMRYALGGPDGIRYFPRLADARAAACTFLTAPTLEACLTC